LWSTILFFASAILTGSAVKEIRRKPMTTNLTLMLVLAAAAVNTIPAFAQSSRANGAQILERCLEGLGYGRVGSYGCG
jgi:hypothetical protein